MRIYLAIPYTGMEESSFLTANKVAGKLMKEGHIVFSPISHCHLIAKEYKFSKGFGFWRDYDTSFIEWCDELHVICIPGWNQSEGVTAEIKIARKLNKFVRYLTKDLL